MRSAALVAKVEVKHNQFLAQLRLAQMDAGLASRRLHDARIAHGFRLKQGYVPAQLAAEEYKMRQRELAVLDAHDKLWAAQQMVVLWTATYGPLALGVE